MALGLLLTLGVTQIYLSSSVTYRQTEGLAYAQESTRFVAAMLTPELRSAGSFGCLAQMGRSFDQIVDNRLAGTLIVPLTQPLQGWEYTGTGPGDAITLEAALSTPTVGNWDSGTAGDDLPTELADPDPDVGAVINSDVVIINALTPLDVEVSAVTAPTNTTITLSGASGVGPGSIVLATRGDCSEGELFEKNSDAATTSTITIDDASTNTFGLVYDVQTRIYEFTTTAYYIGQGSNGEPALFRRVINPLQVPQELVSGVETLQILYGVDTGGSNAADDYVPADEVADWDTIASVRFSVMTRSRDEVLDEENDRSFDMLGSEVSQAANGDNRVRLVSVSTTALRGRTE
jgi:type IV pilus assembly protein PilW